MTNFPGLACAVGRGVARHETLSPERFATSDGPWAMPVRRPTLGRLHMAVLCPVPCISAVSSPMGRCSLMRGGLLRQNLAVDYHIRQNLAQRASSNDDLLACGLPLIANTRRRYGNDACAGKDRSG